LGESTAKSSIVDNPDFGMSEAAYQEYHAFMSKMESELTAMHNMINEAMAYQNQLKSLLAKIKEEESKKELHTAGANLLKAMQAWDEDMLQRKSKAYDDVENFPNKFTANFQYLINQTESSIPRVTQGSKDRYEELSKEWEVLKARGEKLLKTAIPAYNKSLHEAGIGVLYGN
jgi:tagatose-1,6-bisphosphate aldolase